MRRQHSVSKETLEIESAPASFATPQANLRALQPSFMKVLLNCTASLVTSHKHLFPVCLCLFVGVNPTVCLCVSLVLNFDIRYESLKFRQENDFACPLPSFITTKTLSLAVGQATACQALAPHEHSRLISVVRLSTAKMFQLMLVGKKTAACSHPRMYESLFLSFHPSPSPK